MATFNKKTKNQIAEALDAAVHGTRTATAKRLAALYDVSVATIYRCAQRDGSKRPRDPGKPQYRAWVRIATVFAHQSPLPMPFDLAIETAIKAGALPATAANMPLGSAHRIRRELGLTSTAAQTHRMSADYPMQAIQIDGSGSNVLRVVRSLADGDWLLKLYRRPWSAQGYKNKPLGPDRERCLVYGAWDMCTGYRIARYHVALGESALGALEFLIWAMTGKTDHRVPFHGVPDDLWSDQGPLFKSGAAADLLARLDINLVTGEPYNKTRMGGVERAWRTLWARFERTLFLRSVDTIKLSELNARLTEYTIRENKNRPGRSRVAGRVVSRSAAWIALTNGRSSDNPLRKLPEGALATLAQEARRKLDMNGILRWDGLEYEVAGMHNCWVVARRSLDGSEAVIVECESTGRRVVAHQFTPRPYGTIVGSPKLPLQQLLDSSLPMSGGVDLYAPQDSTAGNIATLPGRSAPAAALENPLDAGTFRNLTEAMLAFGKIWPHPLSAQNHQLVEQQIVTSGLRRDAVAELAMNLLHHVGDRQ